MFEIYFGIIGVMMVVAVAWAVVLFLVACARGLQGRLPSGLHDQPVGDEPAFKQYFFRRALLDLGDILQEDWRCNQEPLAMLGKGLEGVSSAEAGCFGCAAMIVLLATGLAGVLAAVAANVAFALIFAAVILLCMILNFALMLTVRGMELSFVAYHRFANHCPRCYAKFSLPVYQCVCGARHKRLLPGTYGIFLRKCRCKRRLATSYLWGRHRLEGYCPECDQRLDGEDPTARPVLLPVIAGRSAGKSSYQVALLAQLTDRQRRGQLGLAFVARDDQYRYDAALAMFGSGQLLPQTLEILPKALQLNFSITPSGEARLGSLGGSALRLQLFDAAGEAYQDEQLMAQLKYLRHCHGLMMLFDPLSIPAVRMRLEERLKDQWSDVNPSDANPEEIYDRLLEFLEHHEVRTLGHKVRFPLAVVVTKCDALGIGREIQTRTDATGTADDAVRAWLVANEMGGLVEKIESQFASCRYFACSAFGCPPSQVAGRPFTPQGVEDPFLWLLQASGILR